MANIQPAQANPLMLPIQYSGQTYFTSQYFHQVYRQNAGDDGKYAQLQHFNRLIRSIEAYPQYVGRGDIVELSRDKAGPDLGPVFKANYGNPIMLINATAQVALTHHLDDEISREASVRANERIAGQDRAINLPAIEAETFLLKVAADMLRLSETSILRGLTVIADNNGIKANYLPAYTDEGLTRALGDLLKEHGSPLSAVRANPILLDMGYLEQLERRAKGGPKKFWSITEAGQRFGKNETTPSNPNETQPRWYVATFPALLAEINSYQQRAA